MMGDEFPKGSSLPFCDGKFSVVKVGFVMNNFLYAMTESFNQMEKTVCGILNISQYTEKESNELFLAVSSCLHSILDYAERIKLNEKDKSLISALRYANNSLKHCIEVKAITAPRGGLTFPIHFPLEIPKRKIVWSIVGNEDPRYENQRIRYKEFLGGKNVVETCKYAIEILEKYEL